MKFKSSRKYEKLIKAAEKEVEKEVNLQIDILYHSAALVLHQYGWSREEIEEFASAGNATYSECLENNASLLQLLYNETGIELQRSDGLQSFKDVLYLGTKEQTKPLSAPEYLLMKQNQVKWVAAQITASIILALKRLDDWDDAECGAFFEDLEDKKWQYNLDADWIIHDCKEITGFYLAEEANCI